MVFPCNGDYLVKLKKKTLSAEKSDLYVLPDLQKSVKNLIVHSLYISDTMPIMPRNTYLYNARVLCTRFELMFSILLLFHVKPKLKYVKKNID